MTLISPTWNAGHMPTTSWWASVLGSVLPVPWKYQVTAAGFLRALPEDRVPSTFR